MKVMITVFALMMLLTAGAFAQMNGTVSGVVLDEDNSPVADAMVHLTAEGWHGGHHGGGMHGDMYFAETEDDGTFFIDEVTPGDYYAMASLMGYGHDVEQITVTGGENTEVNFTLDMEGGHGMHGDTLEIVELAGWAIVEEDSLYMQMHYFLDIDGDSTADYRLSFGPYWYDPGSGAMRPEEGDSIWITGGLMGYSEPQTVVVYEINGLFWREPGMGHGGYGGYDGDCPYPDSVTLIEASGTAMVEDMPHMNMYYLDEDGDQVEDYVLNFGMSWYDPENGAMRPNDGDSVDIVGGMMEGCMGYPMIIVYEINGQFWRDPGDTTGLSLSQTSIDNPLEGATPKDYLLATNYPNPFNPSTVISFNLPEAEKVKVTVYNILGREVAILADRTFPSGENEVTFDSSEHNAVGSSVYFYRIETAHDVAVGKMVLLK